MKFHLIYLLQVWVCEQKYLKIFDYIFGCTDMINFGILNKYLESEGTLIVGYGSWLDSWLCLGLLC